MLKRIAGRTSIARQASGRHTMLDRSSTQTSSIYTYMPMRRRPAARLLVTDSEQRVLLFRFDHKTGALSGMAYWATPGGGVEPGESFAQAAVRELHEETGIHIPDPGPVIARREIVMQISNGEHVLEDEHYFHVRVAAERISVEKWTAYEHECMSGFRWWTRAELENTREIISPDNLLALLEEHVK